MVGHLKLLNRDTMSVEEKHMSMLTTNLGKLLIYDLYTYMLLFIHYFIVKYCSYDIYKYIKMLQWWLH